MEPAPFLFEPGDSALLISVPHAGTHIPESLHARMTPTALAVPDTDWHVPRLYSWRRELRATLLVATLSRYVVDLNRPPDGAPLYPGQAETGVCPTRSFGDEALYQPGQSPDAGEIRQRVEQYWQPYHRRLAEAIDTIRTEHGHCILWDAHSIRSRVPLFFEGRLPDLNVGTADGRSCSRRRASRVCPGARLARKVQRGAQRPIQGRPITRHYGDPARGVDAIQLEIAQEAYIDEQAPERYDPSRAAALSGLLRQLLGAVIKM
ncbi:MAG: N-formylglutamate deformylase [Steroidobacteraceae bacterium]